MKPVRTDRSVLDPQTGQRIPYNKRDYFSRQAAMEQAEQSAGVQTDPRIEYTIIGRNVVSHLSGRKYQAGDTALSKSAAIQQLISDDTETLKQRDAQQAAQQQLDTGKEKTLNEYDPEFLSFARGLRSIDPHITIEDAAELYQQQQGQADGSA